MKSEAEFGAWLDWAKAHGALGTGPSATLSERGEQSYADLVKPWMNRMTHARGLFIHAYSVDSAEDFQGPRRGRRRRFLHQPHLGTAEVPGRPAAQDMDALLRRHGY